MKSIRTDSFKQYYAWLPAEIQAKAVETYKTWRQNPFYAGLHFKCVNDSKNIWSIRITKKWRALCLKKTDGWYWFWIGTHNEYDKRY